MHGDFNKNRGAVRPQPRSVERPPVRRGVAPRSRTLERIDPFSPRRQPIAKHQAAPHIPSAAQEVIRPPELLSRSVGETGEVEPAQDQQPQTKQGLFSRLTPSKLALGILSVAILATTGYVSIDTLRTNNTVAAEYSGQAQNDSVTDQTNTKNGEGRDEKTLPANTLANYKVAPGLPRALYIDKLKIASRIMPMSINNDGSVQAPRNIYDSGWYTGSMKPGEIGAVFIDGHASGPTREGLFAYLDTLKVGDTLQLEKGDGARLKYKVVHTEVVPLKDFDMNQVLRPYDHVVRGLNLMTCTGAWIDSKKTYDHRVTVYTEEIQ
jgi:LPXTG-site transpeptidase (sortase) family protein